MKKIVLLYILFLTAANIAVAQEKSNKEQKADHHFAVFNYPMAIDEYSTTNHLTSDGQRKLAVSYHKTNQDAKAEQAYAVLMSASNLTPEDHFNYAMVLKANAKYTQANKQLDQFAKERPADLRAISYLKTGESVTALAKENGRYAITNLRDCLKIYLQHKPLTISSLC